MDRSVNMENKNFSEEKSDYIGSLFNSINYTKEEDLSMFIENLNVNQSLYCLIQSVKYAYGKGVFNIYESEVISKSIRILTSPENNDE